MNQLRQVIWALIRRPTSTLTPILVLTLGIGATTAIFSIVDAALLRPLSGVRQPNELILLQRVQDGQLLGNFGYPDFLDFRRQTRLLSGVAAVGRASLSYTHGEVTERISGAVVSGDYFTTLGVQPAIGRLINLDDEISRLDNAVLSYNLWQRDFSGDSAVIGRSVQFNGHGFTVVGVAEKEFTGTTVGTSTEVWLPVTRQPAALPYMSPGILDNRAAGWLTLFGRLHSGVRFEQVQGEMKVIASALGEEYPSTNAHRTIRVFSGIGMDPDTKNALSRFLGLLLGSVFLLLLIACGNVSSLLLARGVARRREIAVRLALGAGRKHLLLQLLTEAILIGAAACLAGMLVASQISPLILSWQPSNYRLQNLEVGPDWRVFAFAALAALLTAVLCTLAPIWQAAKVDIVSSLKQGTAGAGRPTAVFRNVLVVLQVMLSVVLLTAAGLVVRTMHNVLTTDEGFETRRIALLSLDLTTSGYTPDRGRVFYNELLRRAESVPGVAAASFAGTVPPSEISGRSAVFYPGQQPADIQGHEFDPGNLRVDTNSVGPGYFRTMGISLVQGRDFTTQDRENALKVAIVNDRLAQQLWPGEDAIGKRLAVPEFSGISDPNVEIIGVARSTKNRSLLETPQPILYVPTLQRYNGRTTLIVRTAADDAGVLVPEIVRQVRELDRSIPVFSVETMPEHIGTSLWQQQIAARLIGLFGVLAVVLASVGLYGIVSNGVAERTREIGIRLALGSQPSKIRGIVLKQGFMLVLLGIGLGVVAAFNLTGFMSSLLYEISPHDSLTFTTVCIVLIAVAFVASEIPTRRALHVDPVRALHHD